MCRIAVGMRLSLFLSIPFRIPVKPAHGTWIYPAASLSIPFRIPVIHHNNSQYFCHLLLSFNSFPDSRSRSPSWDGAADSNSSFQFLSGFQRMSISGIFSAVHSKSFNSFPDSRHNVGAHSWKIVVYNFQFLSGFQLSTLLGEKGDNDTCFQFLSGFQDQANSEAKLWVSVLFQFLSGFQL